MTVSCASPIKPRQPVLWKGYRGQGLGSALHCHHIARAGRSVGTGGWEVEVFKRDSRRVLPSWHAGVIFLLAQFSAHPSYSLTLKAAASSVRNKLHWSIHTSALPGFLCVPLPIPQIMGFSLEKSQPLSQCIPQGPWPAPSPTSGSFQDLLWQEPLRGISHECRLALTLLHIISLCISRVIFDISRPEF